MSNHLKLALTRCTHDHNITHNRSRWFPVLANRAEFMNETAQSLLPRKADTTTRKAIQNMGDMSS